MTVVLAGVVQELTVRLPVLNTLATPAAVTFTARLLPVSAM